MKSEGGTDPSGGIPSGGTPGSGASRSGGRRAIGVEQLVALNDEIAALVRAGVPLELGLREFGQSATGRLREVSLRLSERMQAGAGLEQALADEGDHLPGVYRAVVEAGLRAGRLPEALEGLSGLARSLLELHRRLLVALVYPVIVVALVWGFTLFFIAACVPRFLLAWDSLRLEAGFAVRGLVWLQNTLLWWSWGVPLALLLIWLALGAVASSRSSSQSGRLLASRLHRFSWYPGLIDNFDRATFLETLGLLVRHQTPLHEAVALAGFATGSRRLVTAAAQLGQQLQAGTPTGEAFRSVPHLPPFLTWMIATGAQQHRLEETAALAADVYRQRAARQADRLTTLAPVLLTLIVGGSAVLGYALLLLLPVRELYEQLGLPTV